MISKKRSVRPIAGRESAMLAREPFLSGMFTRGEVVFAGSETEVAHDREPVAISTGEVLPHYAGGAKVGLGSGPCENVREPRKRRIVFSITFFGELSRGLLFSD
jgi:hypothetical protein